MQNLSRNPNFNMPVSFGIFGTVNKFTYKHVKTLADTQKEVKFFQEKDAFPYGSNLEGQGGELPKNIGFSIEAMALQIVVPASKTTLVGLNEVIALLTRSVIRVTLAGDLYCEFAGTEFLPSIVNQIETGATNIAISSSPINALQNIDLYDNPIPLEPQTGFNFDIISDTPVTTEGAGIQLVLMLKGEKFKQSTAGSARV